MFAQIGIMRALNRYVERVFAQRSSLGTPETEERRMMRVFGAILATCILALSLVASLAADSFEDAVAAYRTADYAAALRIYRSMADQGLAIAQFNVGLMYDKGQGVSKDEVQAMKWYRLAADQRRSDAQYQLGHLYYKQNNYAEAAKWFHLAADQGRADAQSNLGAMYAEGEGVPQDYVQALMWFTLSAAQHHKDGMENRDKAAGLMTPAQIAEAQKLAREWKSTAK